MRALKKALSPLHARVATTLPVLAPRAVRRHGLAYLGDRRLRGRHRELSADELRARRRSDTAYVMGSGKSLLELTPPQWAEISEGTVIAFSEFWRQERVRVDFHLVAEAADIRDYLVRLQANPCYADTVLVIQDGWRATDGNNAIGLGLLPTERPIARFRRISRARYSPPSADPRRLVHAWNSSISATNLALALGHRRVVLVGIDLYDREYFFLPPGVTRLEEAGVATNTEFRSAALITDVFGRWRDLLEPDGVELVVANPRSLLAERVPVHAWGS